MGTYSSWVFVATYVIGIMALSTKDLFSLGKPRPLGGVRVLWLCQKNVLEIAEISLLKFPYLKQKPYWGNHFWAPGYCVDTVGLDAEMVRKYVKYQEDQEHKEAQLKFKF